MAIAQLNQVCHIRRGDVVLVDFPFVEEKQAKLRPAIALSSDEMHARGGDVTVAYITGTLRMGQPEETYPLFRWRDYGLRKPSVVRPRLATVAASRVLGTLGHLTDGDLASVEHMVRHALALK